MVNTVSQQCNHTMTFTAWESWPLNQLLVSRADTGGHNGLTLLWMGHLCLLLILAVDSNALDKARHRSDLVVSITTHALCAYHWLAPHHLWLIAKTLIWWFLQIGCGPGGS